MRLIFLENSAVAMRFNESHEPPFSQEMLSKAVDLLENAQKILSNRLRPRYPISSYFAYS